MTDSNRPRYMIVQLGRIGDLILQTPMFQALKEKFPESELHLLASRHNHHFAHQHPLIDRVFVNTKKAMQSLKLFYHLRTTPYTAWIDPKYHYSSESQLFARLCRAPIKIGFNQNNRGPFTHPVISGDEYKTEHLAAHCLRTLQYLHINNTNIRPILYVDEFSAVQFNRFLRNRHVEKYYCVNISSNAPDRGWPWDRWVPFLKTIQEPDRAFIIISAPKHRQQAIDISTALPDTHYYPTAGIIDVFSVVSRAEMIITPDTSIVHIASAFDRPLFALYVNLIDFYSKFYPLSTHFRAVMHPTPGALVAEISLEMAIEQFQSLKSELDQHE
ncbi:glycosyltransferase family 9 protein [candidate division KSB1 bacterium]|nr:glycosyltransferase family 9 protein [candidate division KSB1 bacterium]